MELLGTAFYFIMIIGVGMGVIRKVNLDPVIRLLAAMVIGSVVMGGTLFVLSAIDYVYPLPILTMSLVAFGCTCWNYKLLKDSIQEIGRFLKFYLFQDDRWTKWFILALGLFLIWLVLLAWTPPRSADAMRYHLAQLKDIVQNHGFVFRPYYHYNFPIYFSLLFLPVYMVFQGIGMKFAVLGYFLFSMIFILHLAARLELKHPRLLFFLIAFIPLSYQEATIVTNDWTVIFYVVVGFSFLVDRTSPNRLFTTHMAFVSLGFALGVKYLPILFVPWFLLLAWEHLNTSAQKEQKVVYILTSLLTMGIVMSPFYIRNFINTGNPFWPILQTIFTPEHDYLYQVTQRYSETMTGSRSLHELIGVAKRAVFSPMIPCTIWLLGCWGVVVFPRNVLKIGQGLLLFFVIWWVVSPKMYWRFSMYVMPVALIAGTLAYQSVMTKHYQWIKYIYMLLVGITISYGVGLGAYYSKGLLAYYIDRDLDKYHFATWYYPEYQLIHQELPADAHVLAIVLSGHTYYLDRNYLRADPHLSGLIDWQAIKSVEEFHDQLVKLKIDYVLYDKRDWGGYPGGANMMRLMEELQASSFGKNKWTHTIQLYYSRILEKFDWTTIELVQVKKA